MTRSDKIREFIGAELLRDAAASPPNHDEELLTSGRMDSLGLMRLIAYINDEFSITVPYEDILIENFRTVRAIDDYLTLRESRP